MSDLAGRGVAVTRAEGAEGPLSRRLTARGARVVDWAATRCVPPADPRPLERAQAHLEDYDWVALTSARAVAPLVERRPAPPHGVRIAAVGASTAAELAARGWDADRIGEGPGAAALVEAFRVAGDAGGARILFPASSEARPALVEGLVALGASVDRVEAYRTLPSPLDATRCRHDVASGRVDAVTLASPSALAGLRAAFDENALLDLLSGLTLVSIGPTTSQALRELGREPDAEAAPSTFDGLVDAVARAFSKPLSENPAAAAASAGGRTS